MKKSKIQTAVFVSVIAIAVSSFVFINTRTDSHSESLMEKFEDRIEQQEELVRDVAIIKRVVQAVTRVLPASS